MYVIDRTSGGSIVYKVDGSCCCCWVV